MSASPSFLTRASRGTEWPETVFPGMNLTTTQHQALHAMIDDKQQSKTDPVQPPVNAGLNTSIPSSTGRLHGHHMWSTQTRLYTPQPPYHQPNPHPFRNTQRDHQLLPRNISQDPFLALPNGPLAIPRITPNGQCPTSLGGNQQWHGLRPRGHLPKVRLYREPEFVDEVNGAFSGEGNQDEERNEISSEYFSDGEEDTPYMPGSSADNKIRCLTWLRNLPKSPEGFQEDLDIGFSERGS